MGLKRLLRLWLVGVDIDIFYTFLGSLVVHFLMFYVSLTLLSVANYLYEV